MDGYDTLYAEPSPAPGDAAWAAGDEPPYADYFVEGDGLPPYAEYLLEWAFSGRPVSSVDLGWFDGEPGADAPRGSPADDPLST